MTPQQQPISTSDSPPSDGSTCETPSSPAPQATPAAPGQNSERKPRTSGKFLAWLRKLLPNLRAGVFISYRRADTSDLVDGLFTQLKARFGWLVFLDVAEGKIPAGVEFKDHLETQIKSSNVVVAVVGDKWNEGNRLHDSEDMVRFEIETAVKAKVPIIPVLIRIPTPTYLDIAKVLGLKTKQVEEFKDRHFYEQNVQTLKRGIARCVPLWLQAISQVTPIRLGLATSVALLNLFFVPSNIPTDYPANYSAPFFHGYVEEAVGHPRSQVELTGTPMNEKGEKTGELQIAEITPSGHFSFPEEFPSDARIHLVVKENGKTVHDKTYIRGSNPVQVRVSRDVILWVFVLIIFVVVALGREGRFYMRTRRERKTSAIARDY